MNCLDKRTKKFPVSISYLRLDSCMSTSEYCDLNIVLNFFNACTESLLAEVTHTHQQLNKFSYKTILISVQ